MKKLTVLIFTIFLMFGCSNSEKNKLESIFECSGKTDESTQNVILTYETKNGEKIFYDGDKKIGTRIDATQYAEQKTGMNCKSGTDR